MGQIDVQTDPIRGTYEELVDAAEDLGDILSAAASDLLDLTPTMQRWLVNQLERTEVALIRHLDHDAGAHPAQACPQAGIRPVANGSTA